MKTTMDDMIDYLVSLAYENDEDFWKFTLKPSSSLVEYHHTLGEHIRNHFKLWEREWEPNIINGIDHSENHPDAISMSVIVEAWKKLDFARAHYRNRENPKIFPQPPKL